MSYLFCTLRWFVYVSILASPAIVAAQSQQRWVHGSMVNIRAAPARDARVLARVTTNTPVILLETTDDFCHVAWNNDQRGFIACNLIGEKPLTVEEVGSIYIDGTLSVPVQSEKSFSPLRAFWIEPTFERLQHAGLHYQNTLLTPEQRNAEENIKDREHRPEVMRFPVPEFEAMKDLMKKGVVAPKSLWVPPVPWQAVTALLDNADANSVAVQNSLIQVGSTILRDTADVWALQQIKLPEIRTSFFSTLNEVGGAYARTQALSAQFGIPHRIRILSKADWWDGDYEPYVFGAWDIGTVEIVLAEPVYEISIDSKGRIAVSPTVAKEIHSPNDLKASCVTGFRNHQGNTSVPNPIVSFRSKGPSRPNSAKVTERVQKSTPPKNLHIQDHVIFVDQITHMIDLNGDDVPDLAVWTETRNSSVIPGYMKSRMVFINVKGHWYVFYKDSAQEECL